VSRLAAPLAAAVLLVALAPAVAAGQGERTRTARDGDLALTVAREIAPRLRGVAATGPGAGPVRLQIRRLTGPGGARVAGIRAVPAGPGRWRARGALGRGRFRVSAVQEVGTRALRTSPVTLTVRIDPTIAAAGDISCDPDGELDEDAKGDPCRSQATSDLLVGDPTLAAVMPLGDLQYQDGAYEKYLAPGAYDATWGRVKAITYPVLGNHEFSFYDRTASGYFDYFNGVGVPTGVTGSRPAWRDVGGYYSFPVGAWHVVVLNSNCVYYARPFDCATGSSQEIWLRQDLAAQPPGTCILAAFHHPLFTSGNTGESTALRPLWQDLDDAHVAVVLTGHSHAYERYQRLTATGKADPSAPREFVVGTGGVGHAPFPKTPEPRKTLVVRQATTYGVLRLTLHPKVYDWAFQAIPGDPPFADSGRGTCPR
jgi:hypothetical protein